MKCLNLVQMSNFSANEILDGSFKTYKIDICRLCKEMNIIMSSYSKASNLIKALNLNDLTAVYDGLSMNILNRDIILYKDDLTKNQMLFVQAHELGHIINKHSSFISDAVDKEKQANLFAIKNLGYICN